MQNYDLVVNWIFNIHFVLNIYILNNLISQLQCLHIIRFYTIISTAFKGLLDISVFLKSGFDLLCHAG